MSQQNRTQRAMASVEKVSQSLEEELNKSNPDVLKGLDPKKKTQLLRAFTQIKQHQGPLPDPETLREYSDIIPNGAERIMVAFEKQSDHRISMERKVIRGQLNQSNIGQILAFVIGVFCIGCGTYAILQGHDIPGSVLGVGGLTGLVTAFIKGKSSQRQSLDAKKPNY